MTDNYRSMAEVKAANEAAGCHFFDEDTMKYFNSRIYGNLILNGDYFITSESYGGIASERRFTIRRARADGGITTVGGSMGFRYYDTFEDAMLGLLALRDGERDKGVAS